MDSDLDLIRHNEDLISIRDMNNDLDISSTKWDEIFDYFSQNTSYIYFQGFRRWIEDDNLMNTINYISEEILVDKEKDHSIILCRLKSNTLIVNKLLLNKLFYYYEYPTIIFTKGIDQQKNLIKYVNQLPADLFSMFTVMSGIYIASRDSQFDVLWLRKSQNMDFPWETTRSPLALKEEISRPWYKKILNSLGFYWDININRNR
ncbi:hypothetical protein [Chryseobacterium sp. Mn2064]|uniref:hypothetical protein n=1 Tax=Chryseobacterium sp. Mn2064 TaxID=3395263 RepID=UPI003BC75CDC